MERVTALDRDPELGQENVVIPDHSFGATIGPTGPLFRDKDGAVCNLPRSVAEMVCVDKDVWEKLNRERPAYVLEFLAEMDRMLSSLCFHEEQRHAHNQKATRIIYRMHRLTTLHLLFVGVMCFAYYNRPQSVVAYVMAVYVMAGEIGWYIAQILLKIWERYEHEKQAPGNFSFQLDFQNLPALKELVGEQNWKEMQERSDDNRVLKELSDAVENVVSSSRQSHTGSPLT